MQKQINSAIALYSSGQTHKALDLVKSLIKDNPDEAILHNISGACYAALGQTEDAIDSFTEAVIIKPDKHIYGCCNDNDMLDKITKLTNKLHKDLYLN